MGICTIQALGVPDGTGLNGGVLKHGQCAPQWPRHGQRWAECLEQAVVIKAPRAVRGVGYTSCDGE